MDARIHPFSASKLRAFAEQPHTLSPLIVVYGPTASGKTSLCLDIAKAIDGEIVSTDSRQIYRHLDIGTAKIRPNEMRGIPHHMIDIIDPDEIYSVGLFHRAAMAVMQGIYERGRIPILCGGTGLYIDAIVYGFTVPEVAPDWEYRRELETIRDTQGSQVVWERLHAVDPDYARDLDPRNTTYVIRALEVYRHLGHSKTQNFAPRVLQYDTLFFSPYDGDRTGLYARIEQRVREMCAHGLMDEVRSLLDRGYTAESPGLGTIGYPECLAYLAGQATLLECIDRIATATRQYAKRQLTWCRRYARHE